MNVQNLKSKLNKLSGQMTDEVIVVVNNEEHEVLTVTGSLDKLIIATQKKEGIPAGDSIENQEERSAAEEEETLETED